MSKSPFNFHEMRREKGISSRAIAEHANIPLRVEYLYEIGVPTDAKTKDKIIAAFSHLTGEAYRVNDFEVEEADDMQPTLVLPTPRHVFFPSNGVADERKRAYDS